MQHISNIITDIEDQLPSEALLDASQDEFFELNQATDPTSLHCTNCGHKIYRCTCTQNNNK